MALRPTIPGLIDAVRPRAAPPAATLVLRGHGVDPADEERLFRALRLRNGTWKVTSGGRLADVDDLIAAHLPSADPLHICDVGISSGITTAEWFERLRKMGRSFSMMGIDRDLAGYLIEVGGLITVLTDRQGYPLQYISRVAVHGLATHRDRLRQPLRRLLARVVIPRVLSGAKQDVATVERHLGLRTRCEPLILASPQLTKLPVVLEERDLNDLPPATFHVVRVANVLNCSYFSDDMLRRMMHRLIASLRDDGILVVVRSPSGEPNIATIFRRRGQGNVEVVARLGDGHHVEGLVLSNA